MRPIEPYAIQQWLFDRAFGHFDVDLAKSGIQFRLVEDVGIDPQWGLDYAPDRGFPETRDAVAALYGGACTADRVLVANGAQEALYLLYRSLLEPGDHAIATVPGWQQAWSVPEHIGCAVGRLRWAPGAPLDLDALEALTTAATRLIVMTSPGNPSGRRLDEREWRAVVDIAAARDAWLVGDEEFELELGASVIHRYERSISVSSLSKTYGLAGLRIGWAAAASDEGAQLVEHMVNHKRYTTISSCALSERMAVQALADHEANVRHYDETLRRGLPSLQRFAAAAAGRLSLVEPQGTPFAWLDLEPEVSSAVSSLELAERLLADERVLVMPAEVFGFEGGLRLTYARPDHVLQDGLSRVERVLASLPGPR